MKRGKGLKKRDRKEKKGWEIYMLEDGYWFWLWPSGQMVKTGHHLSFIRDLTSRDGLISVRKREI